MKFFKFLFAGVFSFLILNGNVYARTYTNKDVEYQLDTTLKNVNDTFKENISYSLNNGNLTFTKVTNTGDVFDTIFTYNNGTYTFNSSLSSISNDHDRLQNYYNFLAAITTASAIVAIYDDETAREVSNVSVADDLDNDHLSLEKHGAIWIDSPIQADSFETDSGNTVALNAQLINIVIDLNNKKFIKLATTIDEPGDNPIEQIVTIVEGREPAKPDDTNDNSSSDVNKPDNNTDNDANDGNNIGSDTNNNNTENNNSQFPSSSNSNSSSSANDILNNSSSSINNISGDSEYLANNPKTGMNNPIIGLFVIAIGLLGIKYLYKKSYMKNIL